MIKNFSAGTIDSLAYYVYILIDPRDDQIFYVGKGSGNRVFSHENGKNTTIKDQFIQEIIDSGNIVQKYVVHSGMTEEAAFEAETTLFNFLCSISKIKGSKLRNFQIGHNWKAWCCSVEEYERKFSGSSLTRADFDSTLRIMAVRLGTSDKLLLSSEDYCVRTLKHYSRTNDKDLPPKKIIAVSQGVIIDAFSIQGWISADDSSKSHLKSFKEFTRIERDDALYQKYHSCVITDIFPIHTKKRLERLYDKHK